MESHTTVTLTGTGVPHPSPGRAGAGVLVRHKDIGLQFDAGRGTVIRMAEAGLEPVDVSALFITHYHSDHVIDVPDVAMTRWVQQQVKTTGPLQIVVPNGHARTFVERMLDPFVDDIHVRVEHVGAEPPKVLISSFDATFEPTTVWRSDDGSVTVSSVAVHHEPVRDAVAYRVDTPDGAVVISGDTRACREVFEFAKGADLVVHEACRRTGLGDRIKGTIFETIFDYHADSAEVGQFAERYAIPHVVLTHLIPAPHNEDGEKRFEDDMRRGGYSGKVTVGRDLMEFRLGPE